MFDHQNFIIVYCTLVLVHLQTVYIIAIDVTNNNKLSSNTISKVIKNNNNSRSLRNTKH